MTWYTARTGTRIRDKIEAQGFLVVSEEHSGPIPEANVLFILRMTPVKNPLDQSAMNAIGIKCLNILGYMGITHALFLVTFSQISGVIPRRIDGRDTHVRKQDFRISDVSVGSLFVLQRSFHWLMISAPNAPRLH